MTYLTPLMTTHAPALQGAERFAHLTWDEVLPIVQDTWTGTGAGRKAVLEMLGEVKASFGSGWPAWRDKRLAMPPSEPPKPPSNPVAVAIELAERTADELQQRALDYRVGSLETLMELRAEVGARLRDREDLGPRVMAWLWNVHTSTGRALSDAGTETGYEMRLSTRGGRRRAAGD